MSRAIVPPEALVENPLPLPVNGGTRHSLAYDCITPVSSVCPHIAVSVCFLLCVSNKDTFVGIRVHPYNRGLSHLETLNFITSAKILFPNKVTTQIQKLEGRHYLLRGCHSTIYRL